MAKYCELHARSAFSFLEGASLPEALAGMAAQLELPAVAIVDRDGLYGAPRFHMAGKKAGVKAHIGSEVTFQSAKVRNCETAKFAADADFHFRTFALPHFRSPLSRLPLLCADKGGYQNLCRLITRMKLRAPKVPQESRPETFAAATADELAEFSAGLICLTGGDEGPLAVALNSGGVEEGRRCLEQLAGIFGRENVYVELQRHFLRDEEGRNRASLDLARSLQLPIVAANGVQYATAAEREVLDIFTALRAHTTLDSAGRLLARNAERCLKPAAQMQQLFCDLPEAIFCTEEISSRLNFTLADLGYEFPRYPVPPGETMMSFLRARTDEGARQRYLHSSKSRELWPRAQRQIARELALIEKLDLAGYFLIVWDIVRFCRRQGFLVQGRGSAANSAVCYSLGITAVDPVGMDLLFERFLSEERGEWPDIDIDLPSGDHRELAIHHIYQQYGKLGAAMTANVITYRGRLAAREVGKVLGFDPETTGRLSSLVGSWEYKDPNDTLESQFAHAGFDLRHHRMKKFFELCLAVQDLPRHLGQHSGGMVICQGQLDSVVPLEPASMPGRVVVQWDKDDCADLGIIKVDLLGLGMMAVLEDSIALIRDHYGEEIDLAQLPPDDPAVYAALQKADTVGMFQVESRAQMASLPRIRPTHFYDLVVQVAIIRPGPIVGKMVNPYIKRRQGREPVTYPHPSLEPVLERTLGVPLFQEQLLRMAMIAAGFSGGEAEELRRAFGFKRSERRMAEVETKLRAGMERNGISGEAQEAIIHSITSFALYGFPESHSASFALLAYASAYLKTHYLAAFTAAILNNQPMGFYHPATLVKDAQRHGLRVLPIDASVSEWQCTIEEIGSSGHRVSGSSEEQREQAVPFTEERQVSGHGFSRAVRGTIINGALAPAESDHQFAVRLGLRYVRGLREEAAQALVRERSLRWFSSIDDLVRRVPELRHNELTALAEVGALNSVASAGDVLHPERSEGALSLQASQRFIGIPRSARNVNTKLHRRSALWQVSRATRRAGPLLEGIADGVFEEAYSRSVFCHPERSQGALSPEEGNAVIGIPRRSAPRNDKSPLKPMTPEERLVADYRGTGLTIGAHPMAYRRPQMRQLGVRSAAELARVPHGRHVKAAGCVICRQRPGTASGFVFLSLEDETGIANAIVTPDLFERYRFELVSERFLLVEGVLQNQDGVVSVKASRIQPLNVTQAETSSHDFH